MGLGTLTLCEAAAIRCRLQSSTSSSTNSDAKVDRMSQKKVRSVLLVPTYSSGMCSLKRGSWVAEGQIRDTDNSVQICKGKKIIEMTK